MKDLEERIKRLVQWMSEDKSLGLKNCSCGGPLVSSVVNFGNPLPRKELDESFWHSSHSDLFIVAGSSLVVSPANEMPQIALRSGARLVIMNKGETPFDDDCHLRLMRRQERYYLLRWIN
jgi:NAD-dependent SIR2 family protein deacetylase